MENKSKPDYVKIFLIGIPIIFIVGFFLSVGIAVITHDHNKTFYGAILATSLFAIIYFIGAIKYSSNLDAGVKNELDMFKFVSDSYEKNTVDLFNQSSRKTKRAAYILLSFFIFMSLLIIAVHVLKYFGYWG